MLPLTFLGYGRMLVSTRCTNAFFFFFTPTQPLFTLQTGGLQPGGAMNRNPQQRETCPLVFLFTSVTTSDCVLGTTCRSGGGGASRPQQNRTRTPATEHGSHTVNPSHPLPRHAFPLLSMCQIFKCVRACVCVLVNVSCISVPTTPLMESALSPYDFR